MSKRNYTHERPKMVVYGHWEICEDSYIVAETLISIPLCLLMITNNPGLPNTGGSHSNSVPSQQAYAVWCRKQQRNKYYQQ